jgi:2-C-methyl-D-erythritol 4-phosphate cytidylyltransferase/2-C-methyl-D-erythritol 2,4-cyclodiphosphate synthase
MPPIRSDQPLRAAALIVAAGRGSRAGQELPKQYVRLGGTPVLRRTIEAMLADDGSMPLWW